MGMFNEVGFRCKSCGEYTRVQTKSGSCRLITFSQESVPIEEVSGLGESFFCQDCGEEHLIKTNTEKVSLFGEVVE
ncbi:hypothetical protein NVP1170O_073 [Vibrio phage 1.170.O._10N.261.52.C3]|nr:hypothetical protein NVP1170O_073 [Vibrio phage 1.170.O._10N.261.52.C3]